MKNKRYCLFIKCSIFSTILFLLLTPVFFKGDRKREVFASTYFQETEINQYGTITYEHFRIRETLENKERLQPFSKSKVELNQTLFIGKSFTKGIQNFYSIESNSGEQMGYIDASSITLTGEQAEGQMQEIVGTKKILQPEISIFSDFSWRIIKTTDNLVGEMVRLKGAYHHFNGNVYYEVTSMKDERIGLLPEEAFNDLKGDSEDIEAADTSDQLAKKSEALIVEDGESSREEPEESVETDQDEVLRQTVPQITTSTYLLGGQGINSRVKRFGESSLNEQPRKFSAATYQNKNVFVEKIAKDAQEIATNYGLYPSVMIAQAILESAYGQSQLTKEANNFFGIKFTVGKDEGKYGRYDIYSDEYVHGERVSLLASFRKYPTARESLEDNGQLLANGLSWNAHFYQASWREHAKTYREATKGLAGKYATDPLYDSKLNQLIETWNLTQYD